MAAQWVALWPHSRRSRVWIAALIFSVWSLRVLRMLAWVFSGYSGFLPPSKDMPVRLIGDAKLSQHLIWFETWIETYRFCCNIENNTPIILKQAHYNFWDLLTARFMWEIGSSIVCLPEFAELGFRFILALKSFTRVKYKKTLFEKYNKT